MGRIRSILPGQWTDEDFVECSLAARLLALGVRNEADDNGIFEWRPTRLKMRLFPADTLDVGELLDEIEARGLVMRFDVDGRTYGAIRNFRVYQNPRSPKAEHPITAAAEAFVGDRAGEEAVVKRGPGRPRKRHDAETKPADGKSFPQSGENNSRRERRGEESSISPSDSSNGEPSDPSPPALALVPAADDVAEALARYGRLRCELVPGAHPPKPLPARRAAMAARLRELGGLAGWDDVLARIRGSPFLRGETSRDGKLVAEIDWLLKPANLAKVMEGNYDERRPGTGRRPGVSTSPIDAFSVAIAASGLGR